MSWLIVALGYLLGSIPTAYIAGRLLKDTDIRQMGDGNVGAQNAFRQLGHAIGIAVFFIDAAKGILTILIASAAGLPEIMIMIAGGATVIGHNWPVFLGFRGGRGESTTIGILLAVVTEPMLVMIVPAFVTLLVKKNVTIASAVLFIPLSLIGWWLKLPGMLIAYSVALPCLVGFTHFLRIRHSLKIRGYSRV